MIKNIRHTGIVVRNLDNAVRFYEGLGLSLFKREVEKGSYIDKVVGINNVIIETAKLKSSCGALVELLEYKSHPIFNKINNQPSNQLGCSHIAITVNDINKCLKYIRDCGGSTQNIPSSPPQGRVKVVYCHDPEGILIEIVEEI